MQIEQFKQYIKDILGIEIIPEALSTAQLKGMPAFVGLLYKLYKTELYGTELILILPKTTEGFSIAKTEKHVAAVQNNYNCKAVLVLTGITAITRKRLIDKHLNFAVPGKQLFLPSLLIDLRERFNSTVLPSNTIKLLPSAQAILIYHILNKSPENKLEQMRLNEIANMLGYSAMAVTKAAANLLQLQLIDLVGEKEKYIRFKFAIPQIWQHLENENLLISPVIKQVYVDNLPDQAVLCKSYTSALTTYTDMNPSAQEYFAIEKSEFHKLQTDKVFKNLNHYEGKYCIEVWKYNPLNFAIKTQENTMVADPISVYLSIKTITDERIEMAREQIIEKYIW